jgi:acyl-CoA synthetase (NDP forming)
MSLESLLKPRSVAILGASPNSGHAKSILRNLRQLGFAGPIYPVNPRYDSFEDLKCFESVAATPQVPDLAVIVTSAKPATQLLGAAAAAGVPAATIYAVGFRDPDETGHVLATDVRQLAARHQLAMMGPNCMGYMAPMWRTSSYTGVIPRLDKMRGGTAIISQSGSIASALLASTDRIGVSAVLSVGDELVTTAGESLEFLIEDDEVTSVALFLEQIRKPEIFERAARRARELGKPIVTLKVGRSDRARKAVIAHSGALAGSARVNGAFLDRCGISQVGSLGEMVETLVAFSHPLRPRRRGVALVGGSGGEISMTIDIADPIGIEFPALSERTRETVTSELGSWTAAMTNPADVWGPVPYTDSYRCTLDALAEQDDVGVLVVSSDGSRPEWHAAPAIGISVARIAVDIQHGHGKPVVLLNNLSARTHPDITNVTDPAGLVSLQGTEHGLRALQHWIDYYNRPEPPAALGPDASAGDEVAALRRAIEPLVAHRRGVLSEAECKEVFRAAGIPSPAEAFAHPAEDLREVARHLSFPLVLKVVSSAIPHKSELGLVRTGISGPDLLEAAKAEMVRNLGFRPYDGFLLSEQVTGHREMILGLQRDEQFGMTVVVGAGGVMTEALDDAAVSLLPVDDYTAGRMIGSLRVKRIFGEWRGLPPADLPALRNAVAKLGQLALALGDRLESAEINPLAVLPAGGGVRALDGLIVLQAA